MYCHFLHSILLLFSMIFPLNLSIVRHLLSRVWIQKGAMTKSSKEVDRDGGMILRSQSWGCLRKFQQMLHLYLKRKEKLSRTIWKLNQCIFDHLDRHLNQLVMHLLWQAFIQTKNAFLGIQITLMFTWFCMQVYFLEILNLTFCNKQISNIKSLRASISQVFAEGQFA